MLSLNCLPFPQGPGSPSVTHVLPVTSVWTTTPYAWRVSVAVSRHSTPLMGSAVSTVKWWGLPAKKVTILLGFLRYNPATCHVSSSHRDTAMQRFYYLFLWNVNKFLKKSVNWARSITHSGGMRPCADTYRTTREKCVQNQVIFVDVFENWSDYVIIWFLWNSFIEKHSTDCKYYEYAHKSYDQSTGHTLLSLLTLKLTCLIFKSWPAILWELSLKDKYYPIWR